MNRKDKNDQKIDKLLEEVDKQLEIASVAIGLAGNEKKKIQNIYFNKINSSNTKILNRLKKDFWKAESLIDDTFLLKNKITINNKIIRGVNWENNTLTLNFLDNINDADFFVSYHFWKNYFYFPFFEYVKNKVANWDDFVFILIKIFAIKSGIITKGEIFSEDKFDKIEFYVGKSQNKIELLSNILAIGVVGILYNNQELIDKEAKKILEKIIKLNK